MISSWIKALELTNYRQFVDQKINFSCTDERNMIIIEGKNGFGKSNIYNAIMWCFFDVEEHLSKDERSLPICNSTIFNQVRVGESIETVVKVILQTPAGPKDITRSVRTYKNKDGTYYQDESQLKVIELVGRDWKIAPQPAFIISRILPMQMRHFFFIDGEKLRQLFERINPEHIKQSIFDLSQITLLQKGIDHLDYFKGTLRKNVKDEPNLLRFEDLIEEKKKKIESFKKDLENKKESRSKAIIDKKELDSAIEKVDYKVVKELELSRKGLEDNINYLEEKLSSLKQEYLEYLLKSAPLVMSKPAIEKTLGLISALENNQELPPKIQETFLEELLEKDKCICGIPLKEHPENRTILEELLRKARYSKIANDTITLKYILREALRELESFPDKSTEFETNLKKMENDISEKQKALKEISTKIGNINIEKIRGMHELRERYQSYITEADGQIGKLTQEIKYEETQLKEVERMYNSELSKKDKYQKVKKKIEICDKGIEQLEIIKEKLMGEVREEIERYTRDYFNKLITAKDFEDIKITSDYELVVEKDGFNAVLNLSAAETLCLGYSFMSSLRKSSAFIAPIVIDTPLAKIDKEYRVNVAAWFKEALKGVQVILLVTDSEYTEGFKTEIQRNISGEFLLKHDREQKISEVVSCG